MRVVGGVDEARAVVSSLRAERVGPVGFVPTMGALHDGHRSLLRAARGECALLVASVFVNPLQFDRPDDLAAYPRDLDRDRGVLSAEGVDVAFVPAADFAPTDLRTRVVVGGLTDLLEGTHRPGHFDGVATIVTKLLHVVAPDRAYFGEKDYQQLLVLRRVVADLDLDVEIVGCPTVREPDGLALSSRNVRLHADERARALVLSRALRAAAAGYDADADAARARLLAELSTVPDVDVEYAEVVDPVTLERLEGYSTQARALVAARVGAVRLIDTAALGTDEGG